MALIIIDKTIKCDICGRNITHDEAKSAVLVQIKTRAATPDAAAEAAALAAAVSFPVRTIEFVGYSRTPSAYMVNHTTST
jgi:hypothetical protein